MMLGPDANVLMLVGGLQVKARVQHPQVKPRKDEKWRELAVAGRGCSVYWSG